MVSKEDIEKKVLKALSDNRYKWRTLHGVSSQLDIPEVDVLQVITRNGDKIVQSSVPSTEGASLFATKEHFHEVSSSFEKILGAFKGRIR